MPGGDLRTNGGNGLEVGATFSPLARPVGNRVHWLPALLLSLVIHAGFVFLLWVCCGSGTGGKERLSVVDTRVAGRGPEVDFLITFPDEAPRPRPGTKGSDLVPFRRTDWQSVLQKESPAAPLINPSNTKEPLAAVPPVPSAVDQHLNSGSPAVAAGAGGSSEDQGDGNSRGKASSFFQIPTSGQRIVFVMDRSASMGLNGAFAVARRELLACLDSLPAEAKFQVIAYNRSAEPLRLEGSSGLMPASPVRKRQARQIIEALRAEGGTDHLAALKRALLLQPDVVYFLTDADDLTEMQVREVTRFNRSRAAIHTVELNSSPRQRNPNQLQSLAQQNHGVYRGVGVARK